MIFIGKDEPCAPITYNSFSKHYYVHQAKGKDEGAFNCGCICSKYEPQTIVMVNWRHYMRHFIQCDGEPRKIPGQKKLPSFCARNYYPPNRRDWRDPI